MLKRHSTKPLKTISRIERSAGKKENATECKVFEDDVKRRSGGERPD